ncbi:hypothetical protein H6G76_08945 [Nostoc sp. FACHB-152]|uniref:hypothetical protein n=1 Tax=unclassified Nostoc TaxID=2593658 RepID=UPI001689B775|nr:MULTISPECIES: hypothetical protein [unclassified Nostoc]MBD2447291.1 hypothetical protein [Nostoc sp. FACHB-152]MBD2468108.1 hypothetical protein [Nostoc sp. FACHB-145]
MKSKSQKSPKQLITATNTLVTSKTTYEPSYLRKTSQQATAEEEQIYKHLLHLVQIKSTHEMIERCRALFIEGADYPEPEILLILDKITAAKNAKHEFMFFLNRCCHILINRWHMQPQLHHAIPTLIQLFESSPTRSRATSFRYRNIRFLRELVQIFITSEQYLMLRRFGQVLTKNSEVNSSYDNQSLIILIRRYPYLYENCLTSDDSTFEHQWRVKQMQAQVQRQFEVDLSKYVTYQVRRSQILKKVSVDEADRILRPVNNPTLLSDRQLHDTLKHFMGKLEGNCTYQELAQKFLNSSQQAACFRDFKQDLSKYLMSAVAGGSGKRQFQQKLHTQLQNILPQADEQKLDEFLILRTCSQLLNFLIVESHCSIQHFNLIDLISNQGTTITTGLLLKILLICPKVKPSLEKRLATLFYHYESAPTNSNNWLVQVLEQVNIAITIYFGNIDISYFKEIC